MIPEHYEEFIAEFKKYKANLPEEKAIQQMGNAEQIGKKLNKIHKPKLDWKLLILISICLCFSFLITIIRDTLHPSPILKNCSHIITGLIISIAIYFFDYRKLKKCSIGIFLLATLTIFFGTRINGRNNWLFGISTSTFAIPLYIISFVGLLENIDYTKIWELQINEKNEVIVGEEKELYKKEMYVNQINLQLIFF